VSFLKQLGWKVLQAANMGVSLGSYSKCPVCEGDLYDDFDDKAHRKRCPLCLAGNMVPSIEMLLCEKGRHPRQQEINEFFEARKNTEWERVLAKSSNKKDHS
jgi:hypothetical protein